MEITPIICIPLLSYFQISLVVFIITNPKKLETSEKVTVGIGVPFQIGWAILGWITVSVILEYPTPMN